MELVAFAGNDKESWGQISGLINNGQWDKVIVVQSRNAEKFPADNAEILSVDSGMPLVELKNVLQERLKKYISGEFEVAVSIASGSGKEHMALVSALLNIPVGIKLAVFTKNGVEFIT
jgi:endo-1,4-beta-mannosidase